MIDFIFSLQSPDKDSSGKYTFVGVLRKFFIVVDSVGDNIGISKFWNDKT
jgi:hypothetical protein